MKIDEFKNFKQEGEVTTPDAIEIFDKSDNEHAFVQLPFSVTIEGRQYDGKSLSLMRAFIQGLASREDVSIRKLANFKFPFNGFNFTFDVEVLMICVNEPTGEYRLDFIDPTGGHLAHLRFIINAYLAGEVVAVNEMLAVSDPEIKPTSSKAGDANKPSIFSVLKKLFGTIFVAGATISMVMIVGSLLTNRLFVKQVPTLAEVVPDGVAITAPDAGRIKFFNPDAAYGAPLFAIETRDGKQLTASNPCNCKLYTPLEFAAGDSVHSGAALAYIAEGGEAPVLKVTIQDTLAKSLLFGANAEATLPDGRRVDLHVKTIKPSGSGSGQSQITFEADGSSINSDDFGSVASLQILDPLYIRIRNALKNITNSATHYFN